MVVFQVFWLDVTHASQTGVKAVEPISPSFIAQQLEAIFQDIPIDSVKTGMLRNAEVIKVVVSLLQKYSVSNLVVFVPIALCPKERKTQSYLRDPVMVSTSGHVLLEESAIETLQTDLIPLASIVTPNIPEARMLAGRSKNEENQDLPYLQNLCRQISRLGCKAVLLKGGHLDSEIINDILYIAETEEFILFEHK